MIVRLLKPWKGRRVGSILAECPDGVANMLLKRGLVEAVQPPPPEPKPEEPRPERKPRRVAV